MATQQHLIDGAWVASASGAELERRNPVTGEVVTEASAAGRDDVDRAVEAADRAFATWAATSPDKRAELLDAAGDLLAERAEQIAGLMVEECGATFGWGMFNTMLGSGILKAAAGLAAATDDVEHIPSAVPGLDARAVRRPVGVVVGMAPWNAPVILAARAVAAPLALGNT
ncbi:MAG TPA: aldehyde dehydrogenase family protein, partial [Nocardioides sp.]